MTAQLVRRVLVLLVLLLAVSVSVAGATPLGELTQFAAPGSNIAQVRAGPDGNLWFTDRAGAIGRITTDGVITRFTTGLNQGAQPFSIAMGADGNMWFTDGGTTAAIGMIDPSTQAISEFSSGLNAGSVPAGIALGPDGNMWFTDRGTTGAVGSINPATHAIVEYTAGLAATSKPQQGITAGPDGNLWFTVQPTAVKAIGTIDPATHAISLYSTGLNTGSLPGPSIAVGTDGNLWFVDNGSTQAVGTINPASHAIAEFATGGSLGRLAVGPDGLIWFADKGTTPGIGTLDPLSHAIVRYTTGLVAGSGPSGINTGSDGNLWFTDQGTTFRGMGRAGSNAPAASVTAPAVGGGGNLGATQTCGGDTWSSWAGQQPSRTAFGFDGYRWFLDGAQVATGATYTPTPADVGHLLSCQVTASYALVQVTVSAKSTAVTVKGAAEQLDDLQALVDNANDLKPATRHKLAKRLEKVDRELGKGHTEHACHRLGDFLKKVQHLKPPEQISAGEQAQLIADATRIRAVLGC